MGTNSFISLPSPTVGYQATLLVSSLSELASLLTMGPLTEGGYANGQVAFCTSTGQLFVLGPAVGSADGHLVVATADDPARQWVMNTIVGGTGSRVYVTTAEVDLTQPQTIQLMPPMGFHGIAANNPTILLTQKDGTVTTGPTVQVGSNAAINDIAPSAVATTVATQAVNTVAALAAVVSPLVVLDYSSFGVRFQITAGAVLGTATVLRARLRGEFVVY